MDDKIEKNDANANANDITVPLEEPSAVEWCRPNQNAEHALLDYIRSTGFRLIKLQSMHEQDLNGVKQSSVCFKEIKKLTNRHRESRQAAAAIRLQTNDHGVRLEQADKVDERLNEP